MRRFRVILILAVAVALLVGVVAGPKRIKRTNTMLLTSPSFGYEEGIPARFTCDDGNVNPELHIQDVPAEAASLALIMDDPDAPGGTFTHWTVWNIDPATKVIQENSAPPGAVEGETSFGRSGYGGPCPPAGRPHRYFFKLYALDVVLELDSDANVNELRDAMNGHVVAEAELMGTYQR